MGSRCTHVVFKNGLQSTLKSYRWEILPLCDGHVLTLNCRMRSDPKPHVVGIAWVVECAEQQRQVEEARFAVNLNLMNVAGGNKVRFNRYAVFHGQKADRRAKPTATQVDASQELFFPDGEQNRNVAAFVRLLRTEHQLGSGFPVWKWRERFPGSLFV